MKAFEVGKRYRYLSKPTHLRHTKLLSDDWSFICHAVDEDGDAWTVDSIFCGKLLNDGVGWCVAVRSRLLDGDVVEVVDETI